MFEYDVIVIGSGNAGFSAASAAAEQGGTKVLLLEKGPQEWIGGNTFFTAGAYRTVFDGLDDIIPCLANWDESMRSTIEMKPYTPQDFINDIDRVTNGRTDKELSRELIYKSRDAIRWLVNHGLRFQLAFNRQAFKVNGVQKFWGGMVMNVVDGGKGLIKFHEALARKLGVEIWFESPVYDVHLDPLTDRVQGVWINQKGRNMFIKSSNVIFASGGFEASPKLRTQHLGPQWDMAHVRGTGYNEGDGHLIAERIGAKLVGNWSGCHAVAWDRNSPFDRGDRVLTNQYTKSGYPLGIMINSNGVRFIDEGSDLRNYTYAKVGKEVLKQPGGLAFQIWDAQGASWLRKEEYDPAVTTLIEEPTLEKLADRLANLGLDNKRQFVDTIADYNDAVAKAWAENPNAKFDPAIRDGISTQSSQKTLAIPKSNWALPIKKGPFVAVEINTGITFTFGGVAIRKTDAAVISSRTSQPIPGLYCTGEMVGNVFWDNYPGGSGLTLGTVFGIKSGRAAAERAKGMKSLSKL